MPGDRFIEMATAEDRHVLDVLFRHASEAVTVQERSGKLLYANDKAASLVGYGTGAELVSAPPREIMGRFEIIDRSGTALAVEDLPGRRVIAGEQFAEEVVGYRRKGSHRARWSRVHASPIKNDLGEVVLVVNFFLDITEQVRRDEGHELLATVYEALGSSLDREENLQALAHTLVPRVGSWCSVHLIDDAGHLVPVATVYPDTEDANRLVQISGPQQISTDDDRLQARVVRSRRPEIIDRITDAMLDEAETRSGPEVASVLRGLELNSVACVPMSAGRRVIGTLTVARSSPDPELDRTDADLLMTVADRAATTLENARLYQQQHEIATTLQAVLTPKFLPEVPGLELAARYKPLSLVGHVGGDFYDVLPIADGRCAVLVGDIAGKGVEAAAAVGLARYTLRATIALDSRPETVFRQVNDALGREDRMCTLAYLVLEGRGQEWQMGVTLAGHPPPIVVRADGEILRVGRPCPPAGVLPSLEPLEDEHRLAPGDTVVLYTDGYTLPGLDPPESVEVALAKCPRENPDRLLDEMLSILLGDADPAAVARDDIALVAFRVSRASSD